MSEAMQSDAQAIIDACTASGATEVDRFNLDEDGEHVVIATVPEGRTLHDLTSKIEALRLTPRRHKGIARVTRLDAFIALTNRFKDGGTALFCDDSSAPSLVAVLDYSQAAADGGPRYGEHRVVYDFPLSEEWRAWAQDLQHLSQQQLAAFLEDRLADVVDPAGTDVDELKALGLKTATGAELLTLSRGLTVRVDAKVASATNLQTGEGMLSYEESHAGADGAPLRVPGGFIIAIPVFAHGARYKLPVRLRYRVKGGAVTWSLQVHRADVAMTHALDEACTRAAQETGAPLYYGTPEG